MQKASYVSCHEPFVVYSDLDLSFTAAYSVPFVAACRTGRSKNDTVTAFARCMVA